jgi:hypothetical protein
MFRLTVAGHDRRLPAAIVWDVADPGRGTSSNAKVAGTVTRDGDSWVAYLRLEDPPGLSPITTVGRYPTVEAAQIATDEVWTARGPS